MDGATHSQFLQHSWFQFAVRGPVGPKPMVVRGRSVSHAIRMVIRGTGDVRCTTRGTEERWEDTAGSVHFLPARSESYTCVSQVSPDHEAWVVLIPPGHVEDVLPQADTASPVELRSLHFRNESRLRSCVARVCESPDNATDAARQLVLQLGHLSGGRACAWSADQGVFDTASFEQIVNLIDANLAGPPSIQAAASLVGLSPSHFAAKFRRSAGLSFHRFVNRRRLRVAMRRLEAEDVSLKDLARALGFASQSHLTRLFGQLTGITPARFRRLVRPASP